MKKPMQFLKSLAFLSGSAVILLASCSQNNEEPNTANFITYQGTTYSINDGVYADAIVDGNLNADEPSKVTHEITIFLLTDGSITTDNDAHEDSAVVDATYWLFFELYTPISSEGNFDMDGNYQYVNLLDIIFNETENYEGEYLFGLLELSIDANGNELIEDFDDFTFATGGTVNLTKDGNNFTMEITAPADEGGTIECTFSGPLRHLTE